MGCLSPIYSERQPTTVLEQLEWWAWLRFSPPYATRQSEIDRKKLRRLVFGEEDGDSKAR
ncbi:MAG: hypothetical protein HYX80_04815 [Chloroflexi bacterium]|nr:hypothetical protein [Chloroflexota bacterium]